jgi:ribosomal protein S18 acetylase RimI-like enzyme
MKQLNIQLKPRTESDSEFFAELFGEIKNSELLLDNLPEPIKHQLLWMQFSSFDRQMNMEYPENIDYLITCHSEKAGRLLLHKDENSIRVLNISLRNNFRNRGIGSSLLKDIIGEANKTHKSIHLEVDKINPAMNLYSRLGFKVVHENELKYFMKYSCNETIINTQYPR